MSFPTNAVERALLMASRDPGRVPELMTALRDGSLWAPTTDNPTGDRPAALYTVDVGGRSHAVVFTSLEQLQQWGPGAPHVVAPTMSFVQTLPVSVGLAVNPGGDVGLPLDPEAVTDLGPAERMLPAGSRLRIGEPAVEPVEVLSAVAYALGEAPEVLQARRAWVQVGDGPPSLAIGLGLTDETSAGDVLPAVSRALDGVLSRRRPGFAVDLVLLSDETDPISAWMLTNAPPFYPVVSTKRP